jgi:hypothetical protein
MLSWSQHSCSDVLTRVTIKYGHSTNLLLAPSIEHCYFLLLGITFVRSSYSNTVIFDF